jgi:N-acetyl sugar amidotransferase
MNRCRICVIPDTRPDTPFVDGVCSACRSAAALPTIDWDARGRELEQVLSRGKNGSGFDCIVASSGGKDSHWQALTLLGMGVKPLLVTATTCHLTPVGRANIDNLARHATTIEVTPRRAVRQALNRQGLRMVGDVSWPEHATIFSTPLRMAAHLGIPLVFYGENPQHQYGGPKGTEDARQMTRRWVTEFGGFLGLRPQDFVGELDITEADMVDYQLPKEEQVAKAGVEAHFLGQYLPWDSAANAEVARDAGMSAVVDRTKVDGKPSPNWGKPVPPSPANLWVYENLDNAQTGLHDHLMYRKYGYGRLAAQASVDIRMKRLTRQDAMKLVKARDGLFPHVYAGVDFEQMMGEIGMSATELDGIMRKFTNASLFDGEEDGRPILREFAEVV